jgi:hypothetical protein
MLASMTHASQHDSCEPTYKKVHLGTAKSLKEVARTLGDMFFHVGISMVYLYIYENICVRKSF